MQVEITNALIAHPRIECNRVVVYARDGVTPLAVVVEWQPGQYFLSKAGDADFDEALKNLGITDTVVVRDYEPAAPGTYNLK